jgi:hypothetical protein
MEKDKIMQQFIMEISSGKPIETPFANTIEVIPMEVEVKKQDFNGNLIDINEVVSDIKKFLRNHKAVCGYCIYEANGKTVRKSK